MRLVKIAANYLDIAVFVRQQVTQVFEYLHPFQLLSVGGKPPLEGAYRVLCCGIVLFLLLSAFLTKCRPLV